MAHVSCPDCLSVVQSVSASKLMAYVSCHDCLFIFVVQLVSAFSLYRSSFSSYFYSVNLFTNIIIRNHLQHISFQ